MRARQLALAVVLFASLLACSDGGDADAGADEQVDEQFAPPGDGAPAPDGFAGTVADASAAAGPLTLSQEMVVVGEVLVEASGVIDLGQLTARLDVVIHGASEERRLEQLLRGSQLLERRVGDAPTAFDEVDASGGAPMLLPDAEVVDDAADLVAAVRATLDLTPLRQSEVAGLPAGIECWSGEVDGSPRLRIEVCVDRANVLRRLRWTTPNPEGITAETTVVLDPTS